MPSLMVHLLTAKKYMPNGSTAFMVGNIAPDSVSGWKEKDRSHFRDRLDRLNALRQLALDADMSSDFSRGVVLHLFLDYCWDIGPRDDFIKNYTGDSWFQPYRHEIALSSSWLYHHTPWSSVIWDEIAAYPQDQYDNVHALVKQDIYDLIQRNKRWHAENKTDPSIAFPPEFIEAFAGKVAMDYRSWMNQIGR